jgi:ribonuclease VapC
VGPIVIDTSAIVAIAFAEGRGGDCLNAAIEAREILISAPTYGEALLVGLRNDGRDVIDSVLELIEPKLIDADEHACRQMIAAYTRWGKGVHRARLNVFDCFAYALAKERDLPLLFIGRDFSQTDIASVLSNPDPDFA